ncbi:hypothetical protein [Kineococcus sp. SYSU DK004]|uniref:hypothetical protein n=1 Tax=Kineococcus sp. SYSU DK004 TaxID=3383125 RepID=UPI003D7E32E0
MNPRTGAPRDEGRIALLSLAFALVACALVLLVASSTAVHLQRKRLWAVADAAAASAADAVDERRYYTEGVGASAVPLTDASVRADVEAYLARAGADLPALAVDPATGSPDGASARVVLTAVLEPPFAHLVPAPFADGVPVRVSSTAVAVLR